VAVALAALAVAVVAVVAVLLAGGGGGHRRPAAPAPAPPRLPGGAPVAPRDTLFGAGVNTLFNSPSYRPGLVDAQLTALAQTGVTLARSDTLWEATELGPPTNGVHHYDWAFDDRIATSLTTHGLQWLPIVDYTAPWAAIVPGNYHSPPRSDSDFASFAGALAARYRAGGEFWRAHPELQPRPTAVYEIWNEPDLDNFWQPAADPARYAGLYLSARRAIKAVDPGARVIVGGLAHPRATLSAMLAAHPALRARVDGVAIHPYSAGPLQVLGAIASDRAAMNHLGLGGVPLYVTEVGWSTNPVVGAGKYAPERVRPGYLQALFTALGHTDCGLAAAILYAWWTPEQNPNLGDDWFGIHSVADGTTPDSRAFVAGVRAARSTGPAVNLCSSA
jgi:hypothetical protein